MPSHHASAIRRVAAIALFLLTLAGCRSAPLNPVFATDRPATLASHAFVADLNATPAPPHGWALDEPRVDSDSYQLVWISPTGQTAYGVIRFDLPFPVGHDLTLFGFLRTMRAQDGQADLLDKQWDPDREALRFVVRGKQYELSALMIVRGSAGWVSYAGTRVETPVVESEKAIAEQARERTRFGPEP